MEQNTSDWLSWRRQGLGASEAAVILGISPWQTKHGLWSIKSGRSPEQFSSAAMARGNRLEPKVRDRFILSTGIELAAQIKEWDENPIFRASFDGVNFEKRMALEIKCPGLENFKKIKESNKAPDYYEAQMEQQIFVGGLDYVMFCAYWADKDDQNEEEVHIEYRSDPVLREKIIKEGTHFWNTYVVPDVAPPLSDKDTLVVTDPEQVARFNLFERLTHQSRVLEDQLLVLRGTIEKNITHPKVKCGLVSVSQTARGYSFRVGDPKDDPSI